MVMFCQFWYWYPLAHCACLAFEPTGIIGLDGDLKVPKFEFTSNARPSMFAYPPSTPPPKKEAVAKVATAVLSTTAKVKAREKKKAAAEGDAMDTDEKTDLKPEGDGDGDVDMKTEEVSKAKVAKKEPSSETLSNLSRVTPAQLAYISFPSEGKYQPVRAVTAKPASTRAGKAIRQIEEKAAGGGGILILVDRHPEEEAEFIQFETVIEPPPAEAVPTANGEAIHAVESGPHIALNEDAPEAESPTAFEYPFDNDT